MPASARLFRRLGLYALLAAVLAALWCGWWHAVALDAESRFRAWQGELAQTGGALRAHVSLRGFPFAVVLRAKDFEFEKPGLLKISAPVLDLRFSPLTPFRPAAVTDKTLTLHLMRGPARMTIDSLEVRFVRPWFGPRSSRGTGLVVKAHFEKIGLEGVPMPLGDTIGELGFTAKIKGRPPDIFEETSLSKWRDSGGSIKIQWLKMLWGPLIFDGSGRLAIDGNFQPVAAFNGRVDGYEPAIDRLREAGSIKPLVASLFKAALKLLENREDPGAPGVAVPVTIQGNALSVAGVNLAHWEPFNWP